MRQTGKKLLASLLAGCLVLAAGCAQNPGAASGESSAGDSSSQASSGESSASEPESSHSFAGIWEVTGLKEDGKVLSGEELEEGLEENGYIMTLYEDGTMEMGFGGQTMEGTWEMDGETKLNLVNTQGYEETLKVSGENLIAQFDDDLEGTFSRTGDAPVKETPSSSEEESSASEIDASDVVGTWTLDSGEFGDETYSRDEMVEEMGGDMKIEIRQDGTYDAILLDEDQEEQQTTTGEWSLSGNTVTLLYADGEEQEEGTVENGKLKLKDSGGFIYFAQK